MFYKVIHLNVHTWSVLVASNYIVAKTTKPVAVLEIHSQSREESSIESNFMNMRVKDKSWTRVKDLNNYLISSVAGWKSHWGSISAKFMILNSCEQDKQSTYRTSTFVLGREINDWWLYGSGCKDLKVNTTSVTSMIYQRRPQHSTRAD